MRKIYKVPLEQLGPALYGGKNTPRFPYGEVVHVDTDHTCSMVRFVVEERDLPGMAHICVRHEE